LEYQLIILVQSILLQIQILAELNPVLTEVVKMLSVSIGWIGGLVIFMWWREKNRKHAPVYIS